ncbi:MAG TPA: hypothetical protein PKN95_07475 [Verrucomicrobiota bacterium]|nr:hypothetical protein [Verrucomicrobiota bacterium]HNT15940.1 hypothetical protein [Verrucomicrobiota bacterium]
MSRLTRQADPSGWTFVDCDFTAESRQAAQDRESRRPPSVAAWVHDDNNPGANPTKWIEQS